MAHDGELRDPVATGTAASDPERDQTVHVDVTGLSPATQYHYGFEAIGESSPVGRTRTLPGPGAEHLRLAMVSCARLDTGFFNGYARIAERDDLDFVLHLGDYIYEGSNDKFPSDPHPDLGRAFDPDKACVTLADYRRRWAQYCADPDARALRAAHPVISTVDDHEFADGVWREGSSWHKPEDGPFSTRKAAAFQARWEWMPVRLPDPDDPERIFQTVPIGGLVDLFLTDIRTRRDEPAPRPAMYDPSRTILGAEQREWLLLVVLSGDVHVALALELYPDVEAGGDPVAVEFVTASLTSPNLDDKMGWPRRSESALAVEREMVEALPHWKWCNFDDHGYVVVDITRERVAAEWWFVPTVLEAAPGEASGGRWTVEHGRARLMPVP